TSLSPAVPRRGIRPHTCPGKGGGAWTNNISTTDRYFETMSKRRRGFPSETRVKRGVRIVHGDKELVEKVGRNDLCPCGSGQRFKKCCLASGRFRRRQSPPLLSASEPRPARPARGAGRDRASPRR